MRRAYETASAESIVASAFYDRFTEGLVKFLKECLAHGISDLASCVSLTLSEKLQGFKELVVNDGTIIKLHDTLAGDALHFLGFDIRLRRGSNHVFLRPAAKACSKLRERLREIISRKRLYHGIDGIMTEINPVLRGWKQYFRICNVSRIFSNLDFLITARFYRVCRKTSQRMSKILKPGVFVTLRKLGLYSLSVD